MLHEFQKIIVQEFSNINVPRFLNIHDPSSFIRILFTSNKKKFNVFSTLGKFHKFDKSTTQNLAFKNKIKTLSKFEKILKFFNKKYHNPKISENQCPTIFGNSWSMIF